MSHGSHMTSSHDQECRGTDADPTENCKYHQHEDDDDQNHISNHHPMPGERKTEGEREGGGGEEREIKRLVKQ